MKTSTKLLLSALVIFVIALGIYNTNLKAEYLSGNYKKPLRNYSKVGIKDFTEIEVNGANMMDVDIIPTEEPLISVKEGAMTFKQSNESAVYKNKNNQDSVEFKRVGKRLIVNVNLKENPPMDSGYEENENGRTVKIFPQYRYRNNKIIIVCPKLAMLQTSDVFLLKGKAVGDIDKGYDPYHEKHQINLKMFNLDSLAVIQHCAGIVNIEANFVKVFKADVGKYASLTIQPGNLIQKADLQVNVGGGLNMYNLLIPSLTYHFADSARVSLTGASVKSFIKQQP